MIKDMWRRAAIRERSITRVKGVKTDNGWATIETVYCSLRPLSSREQIIAEQEGETLTHLIRMRYRGDIGPSDVELMPEHELIIDGKTYEIRAVINEDFRNRWYTVKAEERA